MLFVLAFVKMLAIKKLIRNGTIRRLLKYYQLGAKNRRKPKGMLNHVEPPGEKKFL